jgi:hypothetical protein
MAGRNTSWQALHECKRLPQGASQQLAEDVDAVARTWAEIVSHPAPLSPQRSPYATAASFRVQLWAGAGPLPESTRKKPEWLEPFRRAIRIVDFKRLFPSLDRGEGVPEVAFHQSLISEVLPSHWLPLAACAKLSPSAACGRIILLRKESRLVHPSRLQSSCATHRICRQSTHSRLFGDPSIGRNINPCQGNV